MDGELGEPAKCLAWKGCVPTYVPTTYLQAGRMRLGKETVQDVWLQRMLQVCRPRDYPFPAYIE